ncbi:Acetyltransferase (GNAT) family protein [Pseudovibrio axinellae]|uniref:Acetyltransferase (GNAT) family protein n=1 Tax=Pseudovibrio axinellae TaxID=989403 RepID=A0A165XPI6_9HYPH|nr:GNAT family N-acetyltransferase [Pseudovibrio axinellae]KZL17918.1 Acetyltransferase (GNAT) family protein [Pseudovibrio axinellae]SER57894.1 Acetyltransferase (GNAT) family protein [Pseudovibrio axinellae]
MSVLSPRVVLRPLTSEDYEDVVTLMNELTKGEPVVNDADGLAHFSELLDHEGTTVFGIEVYDRIVSCATLHILPNMTRSGRPYCLVENVVTLQAYRGKGFGKMVMNALRDTAWQANAYKIMLLTGQDRGAKGFYEGLGYTGNQKHGMVLRQVPPYKAPEEREQAIPSPQAVLLD